MVPGDLVPCWDDFAGQYGDGLMEDSAEDLAARAGRPRHGALLVIWNASWCRWLAQPETLPAGHPIRDFLLQQPPGMSHRDWSALTHSSPALAARIARRPFRRWLYCPVDGHCADGTLGWQMGPVLAGFDRVLAYTEYGARVIERTLQKWGAEPVQAVREGLANPLANAPAPQMTGRSIPHLPHGISPTFSPRDRAHARQTLVSLLSDGAKTRPLAEKEILLAAIATNTARKDWPLAFATCAALLARGHDVLLWGHTDALQAHWSLPALARQYGMEKRVLLTTDRLTDDHLAQALSAADCGLHIGAGEGFGYFGPEAVATGLPVVHGAYAGGGEFIPAAGLVPPAAFTVETPYMIQRPVFDPERWADAVERLAERRGGERAERAEVLTPPQDLRWEVIWPGWERWLTEEGTEARP